MEKTTNINDFVLELKKLNSDKAIAKYLNEKLEIAEYVPFIEKLNQATIVARISNFKVDDTGYPISYTANSALEYVWAKISVIHLYTNLIIDKETVFEDYDLLASTGVLDKILDMLPDDVNQFYELLRRTSNDMEKNWNEPHSFIDRELKSMGISFQKTFEPVMNALADKVRKTEATDIEGIVNNVIGKVKENI